MWLMCEKVCTQQNPSNLITTNRLFPMSAHKYTHTHTHSPMEIFCTVRLLVNQIESHFSRIQFHLVMRSIVFDYRHITCVQSFGNARIKTQCVQGFFSSLKLIKRKRRSSRNSTGKNRRTEENKYLLHSFKHVFSFVGRLFRFCFAVVFMLKNRISFDNVTHQIPTRCKDVTRTERSPNESWTKTSSAYKQIRNIHIYFVRTNSGSAKSTNGSTSSSNERKNEAKLLPIRMTVK